MVLLAHDGLPSIILVIGTSVMERSLDMFREIYALGLRVVVVDEKSKDWVADLERSGIVYSFVILPGAAPRPQNDELGDVVIQGVLDASVGKIHGVCNAFNKHLPLSSLVAQRLGVTTNEYHAVERCVFKHQARACLVSAGLESWRSFNVTVVEEMELVILHMTPYGVMLHAYDLRCFWVPCASWKRLGGIRGRFGASWRRPGASRRHLGESGRRLGASWRRLGAS